MFMFIKSYNKLKKRRGSYRKAPTTKVCSDCAMEIPVAAKNVDIVEILLYKIKK